MTKKDYVFGISAGFLIGLLLLPVLKALKPELYDKFYLIIVPLFLIMTPLGLIIANYIGRKISVVWQVGKFGVIGVLNTLVDWGVLASFIFLFRKYFQIESKDVLFLGITFYSLYKAISFIVANVNSYYWNKYWTFASGAAKRTKAQFSQFFVVSILGFGINVGIASYIFKAINPVGGLNLDQWGIIGAAVGSIAGFAWNFIGYKFIVFKESAVI
ncbi:GtrA family protein [Candidatus Wolfebacteria bacterium]|nr:GtrA family protein [Candidatus Wolfebacteria bacterium]